MSTRLQESNCRTRARVTLKYLPPSECGRRMCKTPSECPECFEVQEAPGSIRMMGKLRLFQRGHQRWAFSDRSN